MRAVEVARGVHRACLELAVMELWAAVLEPVHEGRHRLARSPGDPAQYPVARLGPCGVQVEVGAQQALIGRLGVVSEEEQDISLGRLGAGVAGGCGAALRLLEQTDRKG